MTATKNKTTMQLPLSISSVTLKVNNLTYKIFRYTEGQGPDLEQAIAVTKKMKATAMLTLKEAQKIMYTDKLNTAFTRALKLGEWGNVRDKTAEQIGKAAFLTRGTVDGLLYAGNTNGPAAPARVLILKINRTKVSGRLRREVTSDPALLARS